MEDPARIIEAVCSELLSGDLDRAKGTASRYPFAPPSNAGPKYTDRHMLQIFRRDGSSTATSARDFSSPAPCAFCR